MKLFVFILIFVVSASWSFGAKKYKLLEIETNLGTIKVRLYENTPMHSENFLKLVKEKHYDGLLFHRVIENFMIQGGASDSRGAEKDKMIGGVDPGYTIEAEIRPEYHHIKGALAAARQGDDVNPEKKSSGEQFYIVQGKTYTDAQLDQIERQKKMTAGNKLGEELYKPLQEEHKRYLMTGQRQKADSLIQAINAEIEKRLSQQGTYKFSPEVRELYKSVGGTPFLDGDYTVFGEVVEGMDIIDKIAAVKTGPYDRPLEDVVILSTKKRNK